MQATRGTALKSSPSGPPDPSSPPPAHPRRWLLFAGTLVTAYALDVGSKVLAVRHLAGGPDVELVGSWFTLHLTRNPGAAFSMGTEYTVVLTWLAIVASVVMLHLSRTVADRVWALGLGLALAGVAGNLTDRMLRDPGPFRGHVIDFLRLPNWPVFNVADVCINVGIALIVLQVLRGVHRDGTRDQDKGPDA